MEKKTLKRRGGKIKKTGSQENLQNFINKFEV
jgi:hypothetical protein